MHIAWSFETIVVEGDIGIEEVVNGTSVVWVLLPTLDHLLGTEVYHVKSVLPSC